MNKTKADAANQFFLEKYDLSTQALESTLGNVLGQKIDYADLFFEYQSSEFLSLEEGIVKKVSKNISQGAGVRAIAAEKTGYAYSDEITGDHLLKAAKTARYIADSGKTSKPVPIHNPAVPASNLYPVEKPPIDIPTQEKIQLLQKIDKIARAYDPRIKKVMASFSSEYKKTLVVNSEGLAVGDILPLMRLNVTCIAEEGNNRQVGSFGGGGEATLNFSLSLPDWAIHKHATPIMLRKQPDKRS